MIQRSVLVGSLAVLASGVIGWQITKWYMGVNNAKVSGHLAIALSACTSSRGVVRRDVARWRGGVVWRGVARWRVARWRGGALARWRGVMGCGLSDPRGPASAGVFGADEREDAQGLC